MEFKRTSRLLFLSILSICFLSCEQPIDSFPRTSNNDPVSDNFIPSKSSELSYEIMDGKLIISWEDKSDFEEGYIIEKAINDTTEFDRIEILPANTEKYEDSDIGYFNITYRVSPFVKRNGEEKKADYKELFLNRHQPQSIYFNLSTEKETIINFSHNPPPDISIDGYELERWEATSFVSDASREYQLVSTITNLNGRYIDSTLVKDDHIYDFRIRAYNKDGKSLYKKSHCCYSSGGFQISPPVIITPTQIDPASISLNWEYKDNKAHEVIIQRSENNQQNYEDIVRLDASRVSYTDDNLDQSLDYFYRIKSLGSNYSEVANIAYRKGISELKKISSTGSLRNIEFRPESNTYLSASNRAGFDGTVIKLWKDTETTPYQEFSFSPKIADIEFSSDGSYAAMAFESGYIRTFNPENFSSFAYSDFRRGTEATSLSSKPNSNIVAVGYTDGIIAVVEFNSFDDDPANVLHTLNDFDFISDLSFSQNGKSLIATGDNGSMVKYDVERGYEKVNTIKSHFKKIRKVITSNDNRWVATCSEDNLVKIWEMDGLSIEHTLSYENFRRYHFPISLAFSEDSKYIYSGTTQKLILGWSLNDGKLNQILKSRKDNLNEAVSDLDVNAVTGRLISAGYSDLTLWNSKTQWIKIEE